MAKINKVGHVVLGCRDPQASIAFYTETLGMELVNFNQELQMVFFSFGEQHHDIWRAAPRHRRDQGAR
jgi:catechol 2,3-dioxygenase-like lactoylglutathione lyase family enzyme